MSIPVPSLGDTGGHQERLDPLLPGFPGILGCPIPGDPRLALAPSQGRSHLKDHSSSRLDPGFPSLLASHLFVSRIIPRSSVPGKMMIKILGWKNP